MLHLAWVSGSSTPSKMGSMPWWDLSWDEDDDHPGKSGFNPQISSGWWYTYPSEKYEGQMRVLLHIFRTTMMVTIETGWWFQPLWKIWLCQLGWLFPIWWESQKNMFQTTNQSYRQDWTYHTNDCKCEYITVSSGDLTSLHLFGSRKHKKTITVQEKTKTWRNLSLKMEDLTPQKYQTMPSKSRRNYDKPLESIGHD